MTNTKGTKIKELKKEADMLWSKVVKAKAKNVCILCGGYGNQAHHLVSRRHLASRFDPFNGVCLCNKCHREVHDRSNTIKADIIDGLSWIIITDSGITKLNESEYTTIIQGLEDRLAFYYELSDD